MRGPMNKIIPMALAAACFASGFVAARSWSEGLGGQARTAAAPGEDVPAKASGAKGRKEAPRAALNRGAAGIELSLEGLLEAAGREPALISEAALLKALRPPGAGRWSELLAALDRKSEQAQGIAVLRRALLRLWAAEDPAAALAGLAAYSPNFMSVAETEIVMREVTARGWEFASRTVESLRGRKAAQSWSLLARWAQEQSPDHAAAAMNGYLAHLGRRDTLDARLVSAWTARDPAAAEAWMKSITLPRAAKEAQTGYCLGLAQQSYERAEDWIHSLPVETRRRELLEDLEGWQLKQATLPEAADFLRNHSFSDGPLREKLVADWVRKSPADAIAWAASLPADSEARTQALRACGTALTAAAKTWGEAQAAVALLPEEESRRDSLEQALTHLPPAEAAAHLEGVSAKGQAAVLHQILTGGPSLPLDQALALVPLYVRVEQQPWFTPLAERVRDERGAAAAMDWVLSLPVSVESRSAASELWGQWLRGDAPAAWTKAGELTEPAARAAAFSDLSSSWVSNDPLAATSWLAAQDPGPDRDAAAAGMAPEIAHTDPAGALEWAAAIQDPAMRAEALRRIRQPDARFAPTERWRSAVAASPLNEEEKAQFLKQP